MNRRDTHDELDPAVAAELAALEAVLAGEPPTGDLEAELAELVREVRADAPSMTMALRERLDKDVAEGFLGNRGRARFPSVPFGRAWPVMAGLAAVLIALVVGIGAIGGGGNGDSHSLTPFINDSAAPQTAAGAGSASSESAAPAPSATDSAAKTLSPEPETDGGAMSTQATIVPSGRSAPGPNRKVERSVALALTVGAGKLQDVSDGVVRVTQGVGGYVQDSQVNAQGATGSAAFTLRVPTAKLDEAIAQLSKLGHVASLDQSSQDITSSFDSVGARLSDARSERRALIKALGKADTSGEIAALRERIRVNRADLATLTGQLQALRRRADLTTITMSVESRKGVVAPGGSDGGWTPGDAAHDALRVLEVAAGVAIIAAAALIPLGLLVLVGVLLGRSTRRRRREHALDGA